MWNMDLIQIQQYYKKQVMLREVTYEGGGKKKEVKKMKMVDVLSIQE
jgi:hypothetical protein